RIDKGHSEVYFQVRHLVTRVRGRFSDFSGVIQYDPAHPERSQVSFEVQTDSIDTNEKDRDNHLRSDDFFAADKYPTITFRSTGVSRTSDQDFTVTGDLTIRETTRSISLPVTFLGFVK